MTQHKKTTSSLSSPLSSSPTLTLKLSPASPPLSALSPLPHELQSQELSARERQALSLLSPLPSSTEELARRAYPLTLTELRCVLVTLMERGALSAAQGDRLSPFFKVLGVGAQEARLLALFEREGQREGCEELRAQALAALFHSPRGVALFESLDALERVSLCGPWVRPMMALASEELFPRLAIAALYQATPPEARCALLWRLERCRAEVGGEAKRAYEALLTTHELSAEELEVLFSELKREGELEGLSALMLSASAQTRACFERAVSVEVFEAS